MRIPLAAPLESRDGAVTKDAKVLNGIIEVQGSGDTAKLVGRKRPGCSDQGLVKVGTAQLLTYWNGQARTIIGDYFGAQQANPTLYTHSTTWNPSDKGVNVTLSNGDLTATIAASGNAVRSVASVSSGIWYWETTIGAGTAWMVGMDNGGGSLTNAGFIGVGFTDTGIGYNSAGNIYKNNTSVISAATYTTGDVIGIYYDTSVPSIAFYKNNVLVGTATGANVPTGTLKAIVAGNASASGAMTANFGATTFTYTPGATSTNISPTTAGLPFSAQDNGSNAAQSLLMIKNATQAWTIATDGTITQITDVDYPGKYAVTLTSLTRSGTVATATTAADTNFQVGSSVVIAGATPVAYNGTQTVTGVTPSVAISSASIAVTITRSGTTATATAPAAPHGFANGQTITISGADQPEYNGDFVITWVSATVFTFTVTVTTLDLVSPATGTPLYVVEYGRLGQSTFTKTPTVMTVSAVDHGLATGALVYVVAFIGNGFGFFTYGPEAITVVNSSTFTIAAVTAFSVTESAIAIVKQAAAAISSITASGTTATVTTSAAHYLNGQDRVSLSGALPSYYNANGRPTVTSSTTFTVDISAAVASPRTPATGSIFAQRNTRSGASFTFTIAGSPATPATGTITATGGRSTVPGIAYIDGRFLVMDVFGVVYESAEDDPTTWEALEYLTAQAETGAGVALMKADSYAAALKEWSTELLWNARLEPPGAQFAPVDNGFTQVGCASGTSIATLDGLIVFMSQTRQFGRGVTIMQGLQQSKVSTPDIERILNADDLATVHAYGIKLNGHSLYLLTLVTSNITLVYDLTAKVWSQWSSLTLGSSKSVTTITRVGTVATVTCGVAHTLSDGDPVLISGANQSDYNGIKQITYVSATVFTFEVTGSPVTPATGTILAYPYTETYFKFTKYTNAGGIDLLLHESNGHLYRVQSSLYQDAGLPINAFTRSIRLDGGSLDLKKLGPLFFVGDKVSDAIMVRWSDDDCGTFTTYRPIDMSLKRPRLRRNGAFERRTIETRFIGNNPLRAEALEMEIQ